MPLTEHEIDKIRGIIRAIPNFPKPGILFRDVTTLLLDVWAFRRVTDAFVERYKEKHIDVIAGVEARGFIFGAAVAYALGVPFVPLRKKGKLPGKCVSTAYDLEYGTDIIEMHEGAVLPGHRVVVLDDLIATGGTLEAACALVEKVGGVVEECGCVVELPDLKGRTRLGSRTVFTMISYEGH
eukprot:CAMPEP_0196662728 /NCGR_PEP_ID=MMETSP1086-20130531/50103_1 /TAXON_ID=77921 /ORGANISM="Cyanoptyche  gloeocystis , Strain SAG4.97" /LENGTH=181 /DNA_ID=CAMNT_0041998281 /DNA_START=69 /DNA_END=614 /DNA_ORIENTATION=-